MDGIDLALIESDGGGFIKHISSDYLPYEKDFKKRLESLIHNSPKLIEIKLVENELTLLHANLVNDFLEKKQIDRREIDIVSFHGHTVLHVPQQDITWQIGNAHLLSHATGINVVADFRSRDVALGGQGAPLVPIYHFYLFNRSAAILNIGGISNITCFKQGDENSIEAFDVCFGNAPFDDLMQKKFGHDFDENGKLSSLGQIDFILADRILQNDIFHKKPPKSFDRDDFSEILAPINSLKIEDALATFAYMHAKAIQINLDFLSYRPKEIFICGGGRKNVAIMNEMKKWLSGIDVKATEEIGFNGDTIEAEAFAFLGIRHLLQLPISFQKTTGAGIKRSNPVYKIATTKSGLQPNLQTPAATSQENNSSPVLPQQHSSFCGGVFYRV